MLYIEHEDRVAFHPAYYINEILNELDISKVDFANSINMSIQEVDLLLNGETSVTHELAKNLEFLGLSVTMWENLQKDYDLFCEKRRKEDARFINA